MTPDRFIPIAEQTGLIMDLTRWVAGTVASQLIDMANDATAFQASFNISTRDLMDERNMDRIVGILLDHGVSPERVTLEVTESSVMGHAKMAIRRLASLRDAGFDVAIDDFGTGYSSLAYLRELPATELKIDRRFIVGMLEEATTRKLVRAVIGLAHAFGMDVVAEGVETDQQVQMLKDFGCEIGQGYGLGKPAMIESLRQAAHPN